MSPFFLRPITAPQMMPYAFMRPPIAPLAPVPQAGGVTSFLANANVLMANAQKFTPYVQQFSPMLKNLPALWRMYKSFKEPVQQEQPIPNTRANPTPNVQQPPPLHPKPSVPKIYQPTWP